MHADLAKQQVWDSNLLAGLIAAIEETYQEQSVQAIATEKGQHDFVTTLDLALEEKIRSYLLAHFPNHSVYGEESISDSVDFDCPCWLVDPLDGTSNFIYGVPFFSCAIAYVQQGQVTMGLVYDFTTKDVYTAYRGEGAFLNAIRLSGDLCKSDFIGLSSGFIEQVSMQDPQVLVQLKKVGKFRLFGSQALHLCYLAAGKLKACINYEAKAWDDLAGALIVQEAGGSYLAKSGFNPDQLGVINPKQNLFSAAAFDTGIFKIFENIKL